METLRNIRLPTSTSRATETATFYYRIAQVDIDGEVSYSKTILLQHAPSDLAVLAYPSLFQEFIHIDISQQSRKAFTLKVINPQGQLMWQAPVTQASENFTIDAESWAGGVYFLLYADGGKTRMKKLVKQ